MPDTTMKKLPEFEKYGLKWPVGSEPIHMEMYMIEKGGTWKKSKGGMAGNGLPFHFRELIKILWPEIVWHDWAERQIRCYIEYRIIGQIGAASCVDGDTPIYDPLTGESPTIKYLCENGISPTVQTLYGPSSAEVPFLKGRDMLYLVEGADGQSFRSTADHLVLSESGFVPVGSLRSGQRLLSASPIPVESTSGIYQPAPSGGALHCWNKVPSCRCGCPVYSCSCDELLPLLSDNGQGVFPSPVCAQGHIPHFSSAMDDLEHTEARIRSCPDSFRQSNDMPDNPSGRTRTVDSLHALEEIFSRSSALFQSLSRWRSKTPPTYSSTKSFQTHDNRHPIDIQCLTYTSRMAQLVPVSRITPLKVLDFYDLTVPVHHHYFSSGRFHHNTGKSFIPAACALADYYCYPNSTTVLVSSTTRESLEMRVWGEIKKLHRAAKSRFDWLPGYLIEGRQRIVTDPKNEAVEGRDFRNGLVGVPCKRGQSFQGIEEYVGIKNKHLRMIADELQFLPRQFVDSISNMNKNRDFKCVGSGNPKETTDALGVLCEPAAHLGGWDGGIDQIPKTKTWEIRFPKGICLQLPGTDSPNYDGKLGIPLITKEQIDADIKFYGRDSIQYTMMDEGRMPRGQGSRRVITRQLCLKFGAMEEPLWLNSVHTKVGCLDAAYRGVGGDRCVFHELRFGLDTNRKSILALSDSMIIPIKDSASEMPEHQIANQVREQCERRGIAPENMGFDSTGRGSLMSAFATLWSPNVLAIEFGGIPTERPVSNGINLNCKQYYFNFVTELWYSVRLVIESGQFRGMTEDTMMEGCSREWTIVGSNKIQVEPKDKMKLKTGRSPDLFDALATGVEVARRLGFQIERLANAGFTNHSIKWKTELRERSQKLWHDHELSYK